MPKNFLKIILILSFFVSVFAEKLYSQEAPPSWRLSGYFKKNPNVGKQSDETPTTYPSNQELNFSYKIQPGWHLNFILGKSTEGNYTFLGSGIRIQTPNHFLQQQKCEDIEKVLPTTRPPVEISFHAELMRMYDQTDPNANPNYFISRAGLTVDRFVSKKSNIFISFDLSTLLIRSDLFISSGIGLGTEF